MSPPGKQRSRAVGVSKIDLVSIWFPIWVPFGSQMVIDIGQSYFSVYLPVLVGDPTKVCSHECIYSSHEQR
jgi:hypothetical protein